MAITPADIEQQTFSPSKHGYDTEEVDAFLEQLATEVDAMLQKIADLKGRLTSAEQQLSAAQAQIASLEERPAPAPVPAQPSATDTLGASAEARENADRIRNDADAKAREVIRQALAEKQNELDEIDRLKASREEFRGEYKKLLQHFMDDAEAMFPMQGSLASAPNGSAGTTHADAPAPAVSAGDFGDLD